MTQRREREATAPQVTREAPDLQEDQEAVTERPPRHEMPTHAGRLCRKERPRRLWRTSKAQFRLWCPLAGSIAASCRRSVAECRRGALSGPAGPSGTWRGRCPPSRMAQTKGCSLHGQRVKKLQTSKDLEAKGECLRAEPDNSADAQKSCDLGSLWIRFVEHGP